MYELEPIRRRDNIQREVSILGVTEDAWVGISLVPRHDNHACTLCLSLCFLMWFTFACGLAVSFAVVYTRPVCGVACQAELANEYLSCSWMRDCYDGIDDGECRGCTPPTDLTDLSGINFGACCAFHRSMRGADQIFTELR